MFRNIISAIAIGLFPAGAYAAQTNFTLSPALTINAACTVAGGSINFGVIATTALATDATGSLTITCTPSSHYEIGLDAGQNASTVTTRRMKFGASQFMNYALYLDLARTQNWGQTAGTDTIGGNGNGAPRIFTVYGRIPSQTTPLSGVYTDIVRIVVTY